MTERTVCVATLGLKPGMRLAQAVRRPDGALLLSAGTEIDADQLRNLIQRGIEFVHVSQEETRSAAQIEDDLAAAMEGVARLFRGRTGDARQELAAAIADYRRQQVS